MEKTKPCQPGAAGMIEVTEYVKKGKRLVTRKMVRRKKEASVDGCGTYKCSMMASGVRVDTEIKGSKRMASEIEEAISWVLDRADPETGDNDSAGWKRNI